MRKRTFWLALAGLTGAQALWAADPARLMGPAQAFFHAQLTVAGQFVSGENSALLVVFEENSHIVFARSKVLCVEDAHPLRVGWSAAQEAKEGAARMRAFHESLQSELLMDGLRLDNQRTPARPCGGNPGSFTWCLNDGRVFGAGEIPEGSHTFSYRYSAPEFGVGGSLEQTHFFKKCR